MDPEALAERLKETAQALGIEVRDCPADSEGGLVTLRGERVVFIPEGALAARRAQIIAGVLAPQDLDGVFLLPVVREAIERAREEAGPT